MRLTQILTDKTNANKLVAYFNNKIVVLYKKELIGLAAIFGGVVALSLIVAPAQALPEGAQVVSGEVKFEQAGNTLNVNAATTNSIVNYKTFNVAENQTVNFNLPSAQSAILNRVVGGDASQIMGQINSNGQVFIINPNGIIFGKTASVNVGALFASTLDVADKAFMKGNYEFNVSKKADPAAVVNQGDINAENNIVFIGSAIQNSGNFTSKAGAVHLAVGDRVTVKTSDNMEVDVIVNHTLKKAVEKYTTAIESSGNISAAAGIEIQAKLEQAVQQQAINLDGVLTASALTEENGEFAFIDPKFDASVRVTGRDINNYATIQTKAGGVAMLADDTLNSMGDVTVQEGSITMRADVNKDGVGDYNQGRNTLSTQKGDIKVQGANLDFFRSNLLAYNGKIDLTATNKDGNINLFRTTLVGGDITIKAGPEGKVTTTRATAYGSGFGGGGISTFKGRIAVYGQNINVQERSFFWSADGQRFEAINQLVIDDSQFYNYGNKTSFYISKNKSEGGLTQITNSNFYSSQGNVQFTGYEVKLANNWAYFEQPNDRMTVRHHRETKADLSQIASNVKVRESLFGPKPAPAPQPQPAPAPEVQPAPAPQPQPAPAPEVQPAPAPQPQPSPAPEVQPAAAPQPQPAPAPEVQPAAAPQPQPSPAPEVQPAAAPQPQPAPAPEVQPAPAPQPQPAPAPQPQPAPAPQPVLENETESNTDAVLLSNGNNNNNQQRVQIVQDFRNLFNTGNSENASGNASARVASVEFGTNNANAQASGVSGGYSFLMGEFAGQSNEVKTKKQMGFTRINGQWAIEETSQP